MLLDTFIVIFLVDRPLNAPFCTVIAATFLPLTCKVVNFFAPVKAFLLILVIVAGKVIVVAFLALLKAFVLIVVTLYLTPLTVTVLLTVILFFFASFAGILFNVAVPSFLVSTIAMPFAVSAVTFVCSEGPVCVSLTDGISVWLGSCVGNGPLVSDGFGVSVLAGVSVCAGVWLGSSVASGVWLGSGIYGCAGVLVSGVSVCAGVWTGSSVASGVCDGPGIYGCDGA